MDKRSFIFGTAVSDYNFIGREKETEQAFMAWVNQDQERVKKYGDALEEIERIENLSAKPAKEMTLLVESIYNIGTNNVYSRFMRVYGREIRQNPADSVNIIKKAVESAKGAFKDINIPLEKKMAKRMLNYYRELADTSAYLNGIGDFATMDIDKYVEDLFDNSIFASVEKLDQLAQNPNSAAIKNDPEIKLYEDFFKVYMKKAQYATLDHEAEAKASKAFAAGILEWEAGKPSYPDANSTMRLTYGKVGGYSPKNGMWCNHYTTLDGVMEKEDPNNYEFIVPARLKELWKAKDYGQYADATGNLPTCFLTNNDITGGNSGSPVLNAKGELIGLAFDGNWESMSSDVMFEPDLQRCICVDIRYVLFMMDKYGKAGWLLKEMKIVK